MDAVRRKTHEKRDTHEKTGATRGKQRETYRRADAAHKKQFEPLDKQAPCTLEDGCRARNTTRNASENKRRGKTTRKYHKKTGAETHSKIGAE
jgi:hypothetical protein